MATIRELRQLAKTLGLDIPNDLFRALKSASSADSREDLAALVNEAGITVSADQLDSASKLLAALQEVKPHTDITNEFQRDYSEAPAPDAVESSDYLNSSSLISDSSIVEDEESALGQLGEEPIDDASEETNSEVDTLQSTNAGEVEAELRLDPESAPEEDQSAEVSATDSPQATYPEFDGLEFLKIDYKNDSFRNQLGSAEHRQGTTHLSWPPCEQESIFVVVGDTDDYPLELSINQQLAIVQGTEIDIANAEADFFTIFEFPAPSEVGRLWARARRVDELRDFNAKVGNGVVTLSWSSPQNGATLRIAKSLPNQPLSSQPTSDRWLNLPSQQNFLVDHEVDLGSKYHYRAFLEWLNDDGIVHSTTGIDLEVLVTVEVSALSQFDVEYDSQIPGLVEVRYKKPAAGADVLIFQSEGPVQRKLIAATEEQLELDVEELTTPEIAAWLGTPVQGETQESLGHSVLTLYRDSRKDINLTFTGVVIQANKAKISKYARLVKIGKIEKAELIDRLDYQLIRLAEPAGASLLDVWIVAAGIDFEQLGPTPPSRRVLISDEYRRFGGIVFADGIPDRPQVRKLSAEPQTIFIRGASPLGNSSAIGEVIKVDYPGRFELHYRLSDLDLAGKVKSKRNKRKLRWFKKIHETSQVDGNLVPQPPNDASAQSQLDSAKPQNEVPKIDDVFAEGASLKRSFQQAQAAVEAGSLAPVDGPKAIPNVAEVVRGIQNAELQTINGSRIASGKEARWWEFWNWSWSQRSRQTPTANYPDQKTKKLEIRLDGVLGNRRPKNVTLLHFAAENYPLDEYSSNVALPPLELNTDSYSSGWKIQTRRFGDEEKVVAYEGNLQHRFQLQTHARTDEIDGVPSFTVAQPMDPSAWAPPQLPKDLDLNVVVIGAPGSGKTVYVNSVIEYLQQQYSLLQEADFRVAEGDDNESSSLKLQAINSMLTQGRLPGSTPQDHENGALSYRYTFRNASSLFLRNITITDTPGEDFLSLDGVRKHIDSFRNADLILFVFDPFQNAALFEPMKGILNIVDRAEELVDPFDVLDNVIQILAEPGVRKPRSKVGFMVSKFDGLEVTARTAGTLIDNVIRRGMAVTRDPQGLSSALYNEHDGALVNLETQAIISRLSRSGPFLRLVRDSFEPADVRFFVSSALGHTRFSQTLDSSGLASFRVSDPIRWVLASLGRSIDQSAPKARQKSVQPNGQFTVRTTTLSPGL